MKFLVIGGGGFIGSYITDSLLNKDTTTKVIVYDNFCSGKKWHLAQNLEDPKFELVEKDILDESFSKYLKNVDVTIMLAANADIAASEKKPIIDFDQGTKLIQIVLEAMRKEGCNNLIYASGSGVYGDAGLKFVKEDYGPMEPISTYGASKLGCEALISSYSHMFGLKASVFRFGNVVGGKQTHGVAYDFLKRLKKNSSFLEILGDGSQSKPYVHVEDVISGMFIALKYQKKMYDVYNLAPKDFISVTEIAHIVLDQMKIKKKECAFKYSGGNRGWKGDVPIVRLDIKKISDLGWNPSLSSHDAIKKSVKEIHANLDKILENE